MAESTINTMVGYIQGRSDYIRSQIPQALTANSTLPRVSGYRQSTDGLSGRITGQTHAVLTRRVLVGGVEASWDQRARQWSISDLPLQPGINRILVQSLGENDVEFEQLTAGKYKRTLTIFGENTDEARQKMQEELEEVHTQFKEFVAARRPNMDIEAVATGEHWLGEKALALGLVDELRTSDDYLLSQREEANLLHLKYVGHQSLLEKISDRMSALATRFGARSDEDDYPQLR